MKPVRLNNKIRGAISSAIGSLTLSRADPATRLAAAQAVFKSREASALPALDAALEKETDPAIKEALANARAAVQLTASSASEADKLDAIETIRQRGGQDGMALLASMPADASDAVKTAAAAAIASVEQTLAFWSVLQNLWYGLSLGSVLLLAAIGLAITFGVMGVINMAHGEMVMLGAYTTYVVQDLIRGARA